MRVKYELDPFEANEIIMLCSLGIRLLNTSTKEDRKLGDHFSKELMPKLVSQFKSQINKGGLSD